MKKKRVLTKEGRKGLMEFMQKLGIPHGTAENKFAPKYNEKFNSTMNGPLIELVVTKEDGNVEVIKMPMRQRDSLILFLYSKGFNYEWIAKSLGTTYKTVLEVVYRDRHKKD